MSKFKVGDRVRCVSPGSCFLTEGKIYEVLSLDDTGDPQYEDDKGTVKFYATSRFKLVEDTTFKVGDKVRFIKENSANSSYFKPYYDGLEIKNIADPSNGYQLYKVFTSNKGNSYYVRESELELMDAPAEKLIDETITMEIDEIKEFPAKVLAEAEKLAKEELAEDQTTVATAKFKELFKQIAEAEAEVARAQKKLKDLRGKVPTVKPRAAKKGKKA